MKILNTYSKQSGYTLIEILFVLGILALVGGAVFTFQRDVFYHSSIVRSGALTEDSLRRVLKQFVTEARGVRQAATGAYAIETAATSTFVFYSDIDGDEEPERVRYFLDGTDFKRGVVDPTGLPLTYNLAEEKVNLLAESVVNGPIDIFSYFDENFSGSETPLTSPVNVPDVRLVKINIGFDSDPSRPVEPMWVSSVVMLRNLKEIF